MNQSKIIINRLKEKRGWTDEILAQLQNPSATDLHDPFLLENMSEFIDKLHESKDLPITIIPDYDADGILSGSLLAGALSALDFPTVHVYEPRAQTGYGMTVKSVHEAYSRYPDTKVIITTDNGSNAFDGVQAALELELEVLITDHHEADNGDPLHLSVNPVNPNRPTDTYPNKGLSGTAVIWKVMQAYASRYGSDKQKKLIDLLIVLVGMSVISDVMPLLDENRYCVQESILMLQNPTLLQQGAQMDGTYGKVFRGLYILYELCFEKGKFDYGFDESTLGFVYGPMLNAPRRMTGASKLGFDVFLSETYAEAKESADELFKTNEERKKIMRKVNHKYMLPVNMSDNKLDYMVGVTPHGSGLLGLIAGTFTNMVNLPSIVFGHNDIEEVHYQGALPYWVNKISGSGRSPEWFNLHEALTKMSNENPEWFVSFGGHKQAAGVGINAKYYEDFTERFKELVEERLQEFEEEISNESIDDDPTLWVGYTDVVATQPYDVMLKSKQEVQSLVDVVSYIDTLKPFGHNFSEPEFGVHFSTNDADVFFMGAEKQHVKFTLPNGLVIIQWNGAEPLRQQLGRMNGPFNFKVRGTLSINEFRDTKTIQIITNHLMVV